VEIYGSNRYIGMAIDYSEGREEQGMREAQQLYSHLLVNCNCKV